MTAVLNVWIKGAAAPIPARFSTLEAAEAYADMIPTVMRGDAWLSIADDFGAKIVLNADMIVGFAVTDIKQATGFDIETAILQNDAQESLKKRMMTRSNLRSVPGMINGQGFA